MKVTRLPILVSAKSACLKQHVTPTIKAIPIKYVQENLHGCLWMAKITPWTHLTNLHKMQQNVWEISQTWGMECKKVLNNCDTLTVTYTCLFLWLLVLRNLIKITEAHGSLQFHWSSPPPVCITVYSHIFPYNEEITHYTFLLSEAINLYPVPEV